MVMFLIGLICAFLIAMTLQTVAGMYAKKALLGYSPVIIAGLLFLYWIIFFVLSLSKSMYKDAYYENTYLAMIISIIALSALIGCIAGLLLSKRIAKVRKSDHQE